ncbi:MAG: hypothetical protein ACR2PK_16945 [Acidimicrobiales bacterium]
MNIDAGRLAGLARTKLESLVRSEFPEVTADAQSFNAGVGLIDGDRAFVYLIDETPSPMAAVLAWGRRNGANDMNVVVDEVDPVLVLQATGLDPAPTLWRVEGGRMTSVAPTSPAITDRAPPEEALEQVSVLRDSGLDVVIEHGVVIGEVLGLEVARVVVDSEGRASVRVGVGLYDQEAHELLHADSPIEERLARVSDEVRRHRHREAGPHPLNRVARERWLRTIVMGDPELVGLKTMAPLEPIAARGGIHQEVPAAGVGVRHDGSSAIVVCSTGIDLDLVPVASAHLSRDGVSHDVGDLVLVLPERDRHPIIEQMAEHLRVRATITSVDDPWP